MCSRSTVLLWFGFSLPAVFIASWRRSLSVPKPTKQNVVKFGDHSSIWDSWPIAFSGCPRGTRVGCETKLARGMQNLTTQLRLALEPECLKNPTTTTGRVRRWDGFRGHSSCLWFQMFGVEAHSFLPDNQCDGCNLPRQSQTRHLRTDPLGHQRSVKLL